MSEITDEEKEYQKRQHEAWLEYSKKHHPIEWDDLPKYLNDSSVKIELKEGFQIAKLVKNEFELKELLIRFGNWDRFSGKFTNCDIVDYFNNIISLNQEDSDEDSDEDIEIVGQIVNEPAKVLYYNQFADPVWSYDEAVFSGYSVNDIKVIQDDIEYPSVVKIFTMDTFDRFGDVNFRLIDILPLNKLLDGNMILV